LYQNRIKHIENLNHCPKLEVLDLSFNNIRRVPDGFSENATYKHTLKKLYLTNNKLSEMPVDAIRHFKGLELVELG